MNEHVSSPPVMSELTLESDDTVTWRQLWSQTTETLGDRQHARWMCETASGSDAQQFVEALDQPAMHGMVAHLDAMIARRLTGEPLQYVLGSWSFRTLDLMVDQRVLIPRPETEWVCEAALNIARGLAWTDDRPLRIADLGTGSGAIGLSLAVELPRGSARLWLGDISADALDVARANLAGCGIAGAAVTLCHGSWFEALPPNAAGTFDLIVTNPPYVAAESPELEPQVGDWEPHLALFSGDDGLSDIEAIIGEAPKWLRSQGWLVIEIGSDQGQAVRELFITNGFNSVEIRPDLTGRDRIAIAQWL
jgi:release factor glutamine methyltransferase